MGHRANLILVENNNTKTFYSHWSGNITPRILAQGLKFCENYFKKYDETNWLLDNAWAEGGILIDKDNRKILFFSLEFLETIALQNAFIKLLQQKIWFGWNINWAFRGNVDFAEYLNVMEDDILADGSAPNYITLDDWDSLIEDKDCE